jgi:inhibitor of KinA sporulation pathway (predicted exonuclease)
MSSLNKNFLALDLELNTNSEFQVTKIIQVGIAIGNFYKPEEILTKSWYVNPNEPLSAHIQKLTGITEQNVQHESTSIGQIAAELSAIIEQYQVFTNPITWGGNDAEELKSLFKQNNIDFPHFGRRIIDVKTNFIFLEYANDRSLAGSLKHSMEKYKISFEGEAHRADIDAFNTLRFFFYLADRQRKLEQVIDNMKSIKY